MRACLVALALSACATDTSEKFQLLTSDMPVEIEAPTTILVQVLVINAPDPTVTLSSSNLPPFATLMGSAIQLAPDYEDAGDYSIALTAASGGESTTGTLRLHITRKNTGPMWQPVPYFGDGTTTQPARIRAPVCDKERDNFTFEISVALIDQPIPNTPDFTHFIDFAVEPHIELDGGWCADFITELPGLPAGMYHGAMHAVDIHGAEDPYGWVEVPSTFTVSP